LPKSLMNPSTPKPMISNTSDIRDTAINRNLPTTEEIQVRANTLRTADEDFTYTWIKARNQLITELEAKV